MAEAETRSGLRVSGHGILCSDLCRNRHLRQWLCRWTISAAPMERGPTPSPEVILLRPWYVRARTEPGNPRGYSHRSPPFFRSCADGLAGQPGDGSRIAGLGYAALVIGNWST